MPLKFIGLKIMNTIIKTLGFASLLGLSAGAGATTVSGVVWDPGAANDFTIQFNFTQWYTSSADAISNTVNASPNFAAAQSVPAGLVMGDSTLTGVGEVYSINGTSAATFCPSCELTLSFGGILLTGVDAVTNVPTFDLTNSFINIYVDNALSNDFPWPSDAASQADVNAAVDGDLWLSLTMGTLDFTGVVESGFVQSLQNVTGGLAASYFQGGTQPLGFDAQYSSSAFFTTTSPLYSQGGNGQFKSKTIVPEPNIMALLGFGLFGFCATLWRKQTA